MEEEEDYVISTSSYITSHLIASFVKNMLRNITKTFPNLCENYLGNNIVAKRSAGHSKWQNIKHIKGLKDAQRSTLFNKLGRQMKVAVQEGGSIDPTSNSKLEQVMDQAKRANMPAATVQSILKSCQQDKSQAKSLLLEIKGPGSCFIICEAFTSQPHQLKQTMATILRKHQSKFSDGGGMHMFEEKGVIEAEYPGDTSSRDQLLETATEHAIESGAEDVKIIDGDNLVQFVCGKSNLKNVVHALEKLKYNVTSATVEYTPLKLQNLQESELAIAEKLYEKLETLPDIMRLSDNIA